MSNDPQKDTIDRISKINLLLPLPYRIAAIILFGIWAWGFNLYYLSLLRIDTTGLIKYSARGGHNQPPYQRIFRLALTVTTLFVISITLFWLITRGDSEAVLRWDILPQSYLLILVLLFVLPFKRLSRTGRYRFLSTLKRICVGGLAEAQDGKFGDILLADALTSYARVLGDLVVVICMLFSRHVSSNLVPDRECGGKYLVPAIVSIPSLIRLRQCLVEYRRVRQTGDEVSGWGGLHLANALKYSTAFPVIALGSLQQDRSNDSHEHGAALNRLWILAMFINSTYSFYWDVVKDWDLSLFASRRSRSQYPWALREKLCFRPHSLYYLAICSDLLLRFTWVSRLSPRFSYLNTMDEGVFMLQFLEVFRRWIWIFFRIETEWVRSHGTLGSEILQTEIELR